MYYEERYYCNSLLKEHKSCEEEAKAVEEREQNKEKGVFQKPGTRVVIMSQLTARPIQS